MTVPGLWGLVLAGGDGRRLEDLSRAINGVAVPKQYCRIFSRRSLLEGTLDRVHGLIAPARTMVIVNASHLPWARRQAGAIPTQNLLVQPSNRDTGPGLLYALMRMEQQVGDVPVAVFPSDHFVDDGWRFNAHVVDACRLLARRPDRVVLLGIPPRRPEAGLGYIELGARVAGFHNGFAVERFWEKPSPAMARDLCAAGSLWNSFVMVFRVRRMLEIIRSVMPTAYAQMSALRDSVPAETVYARLARWSFSNCVLAPMAGQLLAVRVEGVYWNDWGTPEAIRDTLRSLSLPASPALLPLGEERLAG
jgi:mannose-1-phosphate guanylyltransferase